MTNYPEIIIDKTKNAHIDMSTDFSTERYYDFMHHTHKMSDIVNDSDNTDETSYDDTEIRKLINNKVEAVEGKSLVDDTEIKESIASISQYDKEITKSDLVKDNYIDRRGEPYFDEELNCFFANGVPITIEEDPDNKNGIIIKWGFTGLAKVADTSDLTIFGGGDGFITAKSFARTKVTVNSGFVRSLFAGSCLNSVVDTAEIIINGGTVKNVYGGGRAADARISENRTAVVYNSKITMNNGSSTLFVGGSIGYGITENVSININDGSIGWLVAGGTNGATEHSEVNINGGTIDMYLSTNRGYVTDVEFNMTNGSIKTVYCGGEAEAKPDDGTIESFKCNITGGIITNLSVGTDGSIADSSGVYNITPMSIDKISGNITEGVVTNISDELKNKLQ